MCPFSYLIFCMRITDRNDVNINNDEMFSLYYKRYYNNLYNYGLSLGVEREVAKDIIQDIFTRLYHDKKIFSSENHLLHYLLRSMKNGVYNVFTAKSYAEDSLTEEHMDFFLTASVLDNIIDEEDRMLIEQKINKMLEMLAPREKEAIYLRYIQNQEYEEIADIMKITQHSARKLVSQSLKRLREVDSAFVLLIFIQSIVKF